MTKQGMNSALPCEDRRRGLFKSRLRFSFMQAKHVFGLTMSVLMTLQVGRAQQMPAALPNASTQAAAKSNFGNVPLMFEANQGQTDPQVQYLSRGHGYSVYLTPRGMVLSLQTANSNVAPRLSPSPAWKEFNPSPARRQERLAKQQMHTTLAINLEGASPHPGVVGEGQLATKLNYFIGRDPSKWYRNVPAYSKVRYRNVYPGIDLVYYGNNHKLEYDFALAAGADVSRIRLAVNGADTVSLDTAGNLALTKGGTTIIFQAPAIYQERKGQRAAVAGTYVMRDATHVGFQVGSHDSSRPMVIDPVLVYSTFMGGSADDYSDGIAVDALGNAFVVGITDSPDFPSPGNGPSDPSSFPMYLSKLDPSGSSLLFLDFFGGTSGGDEAYGIAVDSSGNPYVAGITTSTDFPIQHAFQSALAGNEDAFLIKFAADGSSITYSTYLGGSQLQFNGSADAQYAYAIAVDNAGEAVIAGITTATDFPLLNATVSSISQDQFGDWGVYGFVSKFSWDGTNLSLVYSTYLAGNTLNATTCSHCFPNSQVYGVATDTSGNAYVTGTTSTTNFPVTDGAYASVYPSSYLTDVGFVTKFTSSGSLVYSTFLGGYREGSYLDAIAVDSNGSAYVTGYSDSNNFPIVTTSICDPSSANCNGTIIAKLDATGSNLLYSTFLPATNSMAGQAIQVDGNGNAFVLGSDVQFSLSNPIEQYSGGNGDLVVAEIDPTASTQLMATFLGGQGWEAATGLALGSDGTVYVTGITESMDFPVTQSAFQSSWGGQTDVFVAKIDPNTNAPAVAVSPWALQFGSQDGGTTSAPQTAILRNMGSSALSIASITVGGDFAETDDCGATVAAASSCTLSITFSPTAAGTRSGTLTISDDAQGSPHSVALNGEGAGTFAGVSVSPSSLTFPSTTTGTSSTPQQITLTNNGSSSVVVSGVQVTGEFSIVSNNCATVAANGTCTVGVAFSPTSSGGASGALQFSDSASGSPQSVTLGGVGADFTTSTSSGTASVPPGGTAQYMLNVSPTGGSFSGTVTFTCTGTPQFSTCTVNPQSLALVSTPSTVNVAVATSGPSAKLQRESGSQPRGWFALWLSMPFAVGILVFGMNDRRRLQSLITPLLLVMLLGMVGCGSGGTKSAVTARVTPPGTYSINVIAKSGNLQHVTQLTLVVQ